MNYDYMLVDCEAGLEHISRRIIQDVTDLFVISDATVRGLRSATRVRELVTELKLPVFRLYLIVTKVTSDLAPLEEEIRRTGLPFAGTIPYDEQIVNYDIYGKSLLDLPANAAALQAANTILARCQL
jgi:CO dehydrogenase maturation factor